MQDHAAHEENAQTQGATPPGGQPPQKPPTTGESDKTEGESKPEQFLNQFEGTNNSLAEQIVNQAARADDPIGIEGSGISEGFNESEPDGKRKRSAAFSLTWLYLSGARDALCAAMWESDDISSQARLADHVKTVDTLLRQGPKAEQFTIGVNGIGRKAQLLDESCKSRCWAEVEHYIIVFKTAFGI